MVSRRYAEWGLKYISSVLTPLCTGNEFTFKKPENQI